MSFNTRLVLLCVGALTVALVVEAATNHRPAPGDTSLGPLVRESWLGIVAGLVVGVMPLLFLLSSQLTAEARTRAVATARGEREGAARLADLAGAPDTSGRVTVDKLASMAHELGTPLGVVQARAQMIADGEVIGEEQRRDVEVILQQTRRMTKMVREVLELAQVQATTSSRGGD